MWRHGGPNRDEFTKFLRDFLFGKGLELPKVVAVIEWQALAWFLNNAAMRLELTYLKFFVDPEAYIVLEPVHTGSQVPSHMRSIHPISVVESMEVETYHFTWGPVLSPNYDMDA